MNVKISLRALSSSKSLKFFVTFFINAADEIGFAFSSKSPSSPNGVCLNRK